MLFVLFYKVFNADRDQLHYDAFLRLQSSHSLSPDTAGSALTLQLNVVAIDSDAKMPK